MSRISQSPLDGLGPSSAGPLQPTQLGVCGERSAVITLGTRAVFIEVETPPLDAAPDESKMQEEEKEAEEAGPEPKPFSSVKCRPLALAEAPRSELQAVSTQLCGDGAWRVGLTTGCGSATVSTIAEGGVSAQSSSTKRQRLAADEGVPMTMSNTLHLSASGDDSRTEFGWTGVALHPTDIERNAVVSQYGRIATLWQGERPIRHMYTTGMPNAACFVTPPASDYALLATVQQGALLVWDDRVGGNPCVQTCGSNDSSTWYAMDHHSETGCIAVAGDDKSVVLFDMRRWRPLGSIPKATKHEIVGVKCSYRDPNLCYVVSLDQEVLAVRWQASGKAKKVPRFSRQGFRGDTRWLGFGLHENSDILMGFTETPRFYLIDEPALLEV